MSHEPDLFVAIHSLVGGGISGASSDFDSFIYHDGQTPPTKAEAEAELARLNKKYNAEKYQRERLLEYPEWDFQLDYIFHNGLAKWKTDIVQPVKDKYPKP